MNSFDVRGKRALLVGRASKALLAIGQTCIEAGADVAVLSYGESPTPLVDTAKALGRTVRVFPLKVQTPIDVETALEEASQTLPSVDILVNNGVTEFFKPAKDTTRDEWRVVMELGPTLVFLACRIIGARMAEQGKGRIITLLPALSERGMPNSAAAAASAGALRQMMTALALEWARSGVRVNGIVVGWSQDSGLGADAQKFAKYIPARRPGQAQDLCGLALYLASDASQFVTGQFIPVDGGVLVRP
ncbi:MAG: SDR family oxidoreductase [Chloroflexi bacterium]|nr:SDR family oxidoreductase [Chloroflexota bacterium]